MQARIAALSKELQAYQASTPEAVEAFRRRFVGKKGAIAELFVALRSCPPTERAAWGAALNALKRAAQQRYAGLQQALAAAAPVVSEAGQEAMLPPPAHELGSLHPLTLIAQRLQRILVPLGFEPVTGPEVEDEWHNFTALNFGTHHPARDMHDTFFLQGPEDRLLRTHTSSVQVRVMQERTPPLRVFCSGRVFRKETISARSHCTFHQLEGLYVDNKVSFADLKALLHQLVEAFFGSQTRLRLRPSYFPFTEPSVEIDVSCLLCQGAGCQVCKRTGWVEVAGAGMVDPEVLTHCGIDPETYTGYAFGLGLERLAMLYYGIPDVRLFTQNDLRFLRQFVAAS